MKISLYTLFTWCVSTTYADSRNRLNRNGSGKQPHTGKNTPSLKWRLTNNKYNFLTQPNLPN